METNRIDEMLEDTSLRYNQLMKRTVDDLILYVLDLENELDKLFHTKSDDVYNEYKARICDYEVSRANMERVNDFNKEKIEKLESMLESIKKIVTSTDVVVDPQATETDSVPRKRSDLVDVECNCEECVGFDPIDDSNSDDSDDVDDIDYAYEAGWDDGYSDACDGINYNICDERNKQYAAGYSDGYDVGPHPLRRDYRTTSTKLATDDCDCDDQ